MIVFSQFPNRSGIGFLGPRGETTQLHVLDHAFAQSAHSRPPENRLRPYGHRASTMLQHPSQEGRKPAAQAAQFNMALHWIVISPRFIATSELGRYSLPIHNHGRSHCPPTRKISMMKLEDYGMNASPNRLSEKKVNSLLFTSDATGAAILIAATGASFLFIQHSP